MEEPGVAAGEETGISLLAVNPDGELTETVEWGITGQGWIQTETDELPGAYVAAAQGEFERNCSSNTIAPLPLNPPLFPWRTATSQ